MDATILEAYDQARDFSNKSFRSACYAPYVAMLFDPLGDVRVCCRNFTYTLGNVATQRLGEIWTGKNIQLIRSALKKYNFNLGCDYCKWQIQGGDYLHAFTREFEDYTVDEQSLWPQMMEFNVSNTCNLECVMCNGEFSSAIRGRREHLPPLPKPYGEQFFKDLEGFLPHLKLVKCLGGEPFLAQEMYRIWDMLIAAGLKVRCHINTNATIYNAKVERVLENLPCTFQVSMDGATKETFEKVRVAANFETVMENFARLHAYSRRRPDGYISITFCMMRQNWHELGAMLLFADQWDTHVATLPVVTPANCSLYTLPAPELAEIVGKLEEQEKTILPRLTKNAPVWKLEMERLRGQLEQMKTNKPIMAALRLLEPFHGIEIQTPVDHRTIDARSTLESWSGGPVVELLCDSEDTVTDLISTDDAFLGIPRKHCIGKRIDVVFSQFRVLHGGATDIVRVTEEEEQVDRILSFGRTGEQVMYIRSITLPLLDSSGKVAGSRLLATQSTQLKSATETVSAR